MKALTIVGSPKGRRSASAVLMAELAETMRASGAECTEAVLGKDLDAVVEQAAAADVVVLAFPLYVDSLPAPVTRLLETMAERGVCAGKRFATVVQCGFPEAAQCDTALDICRLFAARTGMEWAGGLAMGMGGSVGAGLERLPPKGAARVREALRLTGRALASTERIPAAARELFATPLMPSWLYTAAGNLGWRLQMRQHKAKRPIAFRAYPQG